MKRFFKIIVAIFRWDLDVVCEMSAGMNEWDYHDYPDDKDNTGPWHFVLMECERCGKRFYM